jgi:hypothetical protein
MDTANIFEALSEYRNEMLKFNERTHLNLNKLKDLYKARLGLKNLLICKFLLRFILPFKKLFCHILLFMFF